MYHTLQVAVRKLQCPNKTEEEILNFFDSKMEEILGMFDEGRSGYDLDEDDRKISLFAFKITSLEDYEKILSIFSCEDETSEYYQYRVVSCENWFEQATNILNPECRTLASEGFIDDMRFQLINLMENGLEIKHKEMSFYLVFQIFERFYRSYGYRLKDTFIRGQIKSVIEFFEYCDIQDENFFLDFTEKQASLMHMISYFVNRRKTFLKRIVNIFKMFTIFEDARSSYDSLRINKEYLQAKGICPGCYKKTNLRFVTLANTTKQLICDNLYCSNGYSSVNISMMEHHFKQGEKTQAVEDNYSLFGSNEVLLSLCIMAKAERIEEEKLFNVLYGQSTNYGFYQLKSSSEAQINTVPLGIKTFGKLCKKLENAGFAIETVTLNQISNFSPEIEAKILELITNKVLKVSLNKTIILDLVEMKIHVCENEAEPTEALPFVFKKTQEDEQGLCDAVFYSGVIDDENSKILLSIF